MDHPLNNNPDSEWNTYFKDNDVLLQIDKDVRFVVIYLSSCAYMCVYVFCIIYYSSVLFIFILAFDFISLYNCQIGVGRKFPIVDFVTDETNRTD